MDGSLLLPHFSLGDFRAENTTTRKNTRSIFKAAIQQLRRNRSRPVYEVSGGGEFNGKTDRGWRGASGEGVEGERRWKGGGGGRVVAALKRACK